MKIDAAFRNSVLALPALATAFAAVAAGTVAMTAASSDASAWTNSCRGSGCYRQSGGPPLAPKPDRPNQQKR